MTHYSMRRLVLSVGILAALATIPALAQRTVDTIVTHGKILTVDADFRVDEALAIDAGRIVARGTSAEVGAVPTPGTNRPASKASARAATRSRFSRPRRRA